MSRDRRSVRIPVVLLVALWFVGCDAAPGPPDVTERPPVLSGLVLTPSSVVATPGQPTTMDVTVRWIARDVDGDLDRVFVVVQSPDRGQAPIGRTDVPAAQGGGLATVTVTFPAGAAGAHPVVVSAADARGTLSNMLVGSIEVVGGSEPPVITSIEAPDRIVRPASGQPPVTVSLVAVVDDPDGLANVDRVEVQVNGAVVLQLCDDGGVGSCNAGFGGSGDVVAGDGRFTVTIQVTSSNAAGVNTFAFKAIDRSGLESAVITRNITLE